MTPICEGGRGLRALHAVAFGLACAWGGAAVAGDTVLPARGSVETVYFGDRRLPPVKLVRGNAAAAASSVPSLPVQPFVRREVVSFGNGTAERVTIVRGTFDPTAATPARQAALGPQHRIEQVSFADPTQPFVTVVRGGLALREAFSIDLFGPAHPGEFDRIAFAVHGVESSHGTNPAMWRPNPAGPQGPMQVSAAAAFDVGGGDRFDLDDNRRLGRAYLDKMFRRYGNWPDALAGYNWGPGNVDQWIAAGRRIERMPLETVRYIERVLRDALLTRIAARP